MLTRVTMKASSAKTAITITIVATISPKPVPMRCVYPETGRPNLRYDCRSGHTRRVAQQPMRNALSEARRVVRGETPVHLHLRQRLVTVVVFVAIFDVFSTIVIFFLERNAAGTKIHTIFDSLFWTTTQLLTVSSQLPNPVSSAARFYDFLLQAVAISVVATLAGSVGTFFNHRSIQRHYEETGEKLI